MEDGQRHTLDHKKRAQTFNKVSESLLVQQCHKGATEGIEFVLA